MRGAQSIGKGAAFLEDGGPVRPDLKTAPESNSLRDWY